MRWCSCTALLSAGPENPENAQEAVCFGGDASGRGSPSTSSFLSSCSSFLSFICVNSSGWWPRVATAALLSTTPATSPPIPVPALAFLSSRTTASATNSGRDSPPNRQAPAWRGRLASTLGAHASLLSCPGCAPAPIAYESSPAHVRRVRALLLPGASLNAAGTYTSRVRIHSHEYASRALGPSSSAVGRRAASPAGESLAQCHNVASSTAPEAAATSTGFDRDSQRRSLLCAPSSGASSPRCSGSSALVPAIRTRCVRGTCQGAAAPCSPLRYRKSVVVIRRKRWAALLCVSVFSTVGRC